MYDPHRDEETPDERLHETIALLLLDRREAVRKPHGGLELSHSSSQLVQGVPHLNIITTNQHLVSNAERGPLGLGIRLVQL